VTPCVATGQWALVVASPAFCGWGQGPVAWNVWILWLDAWEAVSRAFPEPRLTVCQFVLNPKPSGYAPEEAAPSHAKHWLLNAHNTSSTPQTAR